MRLYIYIRNIDFIKKMLIEICVKKSKFWSKIEILVKNRIFEKPEILVKNRNFARKIEILLKNRNFHQKSKFLSKNRNSSVFIFPIYSQVDVLKIPIYFLIQSEH